MKKIIKYGIEIANRVLKDKRIFYYSPNEHNGFGKTAVKTKFGFWYVGNVLDQRDIACGILKYGLVEPGETTLTLKIYEYLKQKGKPTIFDIGANTGYYGLLAAHFFDNNVDVFSFEPVKEYSDCIKESSIMNGFDKSIHVCNFALSNTDGSGQIYVWGTCSSLDKDFNNKDLPSQTIQLKKLDDFAVNIAPDFIKIDTEGHELATLEGGVETIRKSKPILFVEIIERLKMRNFVNKNYTKTVQLLLDMGYDAYLFRDGTLEKRNGANPPLEGVYMHLFVHKEKHREFIKKHMLCA
jgi:FkbM family methyltransferase